MLDPLALYDVGRGLCDGSISHHGGLLYRGVAIALANAFPKFLRKRVETVSSTVSRKPNLDSMHIANGDSRYIIRMEYLRFTPGYGHLKYRLFSWQPIPADRAVRVDIEKLKP